MNIAFYYYTIYLTIVTILTIPVSLTIELMYQF